MILASYIVFTFGALTFSILAVYYWRERRLRPRPDGAAVFPAFTVTCAVAFAINLMRLANIEAIGTGVLLDVATGILPALLAHIICVEEQRRSGGWRLMLAVLYAGGILSALSQSSRWADQLAAAPIVMLGLAGAGGLAATFQRRKLRPPELRHRRWNRGLSGMLMLCALGSLVRPDSLVSLVPDYLLLCFFCVTLYYKERLIFFDLLIKRGAFFAAALVGLTLFFAGMPLRRDEPWLNALLLAPLWLAGPWLYRRLGAAIDHAWLGRRFSVPEAERRFTGDVQGALHEDDLRARAIGSLSKVFQTPADVLFEAVPAPSQPPDGLIAALEHRSVTLGWIILDARLTSTAFLSDDQRLLHSLARTLAVLLENVRYRHDEQHLRWLASRAELKALRAQINPHFLFNALNSIAGLIRDQPQLADETIEQLAHVFRYTLRKSDQEWVRLEEELEFVRAYLRVEQARFGDRLQVEFHVEAAAADLQIPAMTIQPLIENAVRHGVAQVEGAGVIALRATMCGPRLSVTVSDNGPGFPVGFTLGQGSGHGLRNVAERLKGYYGSDAGLRWESGPWGSRVELTAECAR